MTSPPATQAEIHGANHGANHGEHAGRHAPPDPARASHPRLAALADMLATFGAPADAVATLGERLRRLVDAGCDRLARPGAGATAARWRALALVAAHDAQLAKLFEGHTDALAILDELGARVDTAGRLFGVWAAEPRDARVLIASGAATARLRGRKAWCSGAAVLTDALVTAWDERGAQRLAAVRLDQRGVQVSDRGWSAIGMAATASVEVTFDDAVAVPVGGPDAYVRRPGFQHGGAGIAACWHGAACAIADAVRTGMPGRDGAPDPHALAHLGAIEVALVASAASLREAATFIDAHPAADATRIAMRARLVTERAAAEVVDRAGRVLGAAPFCRDRALAHRLADLPVFLRQSHAERDLARLGALVIAEERRDADRWI